MARVGLGESFQDVAKPPVNPTRTKAAADVTGGTKGFHISDASHRGLPRGLEVPLHTDIMELPPRGGPASWCNPGIASARRGRGLARKGARRGPPDSPAPVTGQRGTGRRGCGRVLTTHTMGHKEAESEPHFQGQPHTHQLSCPGKALLFGSYFPHLRSQAAWA